MCENWFWFFFFVGSTILIYTTHVVLISYISPRFSAIRVSWILSDIQICVTSVFSSVYLVLHSEYNNTF